MIRVCRRVPYTSSMHSRSLPPWKGGAILGTAGLWSLIVVSHNTPALLLQ